MKKSTFKQNPKTHNYNKNMQISKHINHIQITCKKTTSKHINHMKKINI